MTQLLEIIAILSGIISVWFSRKENIWVYPSGLIGTALYVFISIEGDLYGEATVNLYYTIMSIYGWYNWLRKDTALKPIVHIRFSNKHDWRNQIIFFISTYCIIYTSLYFIKQYFNPGAIPWADALASASAFTAMWLMTRKKVESWIWWIITNLASMPLYYVKGYTFTSVYYSILLLMAIAGFIEWRKKANEQSVSQ
ncbi:MAG: nicotinamide riboside transporter PnuC [Bacteroidota bacterium]|jgi:nicotinamide mononucleotide transporter